MNKYRPSAVILLSCLSMLLSGCSNEGQGGSISSPLTLWSTSSLDRVMRNDESPDTRQKSMSILMGKNEKEGAQLNLRSTSPIKAYDISVSDLVSSDHRFVLPKENISFYNVKYISSVGINSRYNNPSMPSGSLVPDALLPFETAIEYGENTLPSNVNQSIYVEVKTLKNTQAGVYSGQLKLSADTYAHYVPITVRVADFTVPDMPSTANYFAMWGSEHYNSAELSSDEELTTKYYETLLDHRMSSNLPFEGEGGAEKYVELLRKYYNAPGFSAYKFFYEATYSAYNDTLIAFNVPLCKTYLRAVIDASLEDGVNYLDKAFFYFSTFVDEPDSNPGVTWEMVRQIATTVKKMLVDLAEELDVSLSSNKAYSYYRSTIRETLIDIPNIIPGGYSIETIENVGAGDISACTSLDRFDSEESRESYKRSGNQQEWWYTCIGPQYPYPNLLINSYLSSPRLISWMQKYYDLDGFLIWDAVNYTDSDNNATPIVNGYDDLGDTMTGVSDGKIFYPGKPYGIDGPISSLRAVSYRDGMEDAELIEAIKQRYEEFGLDADEALEEAMSKEFQGVVTNGSSSDFASSRKALMETYENINSSTALLFASSKDGEAQNQKTVSFILPNSAAKASIDGKELTKGDDGYYSFTLDASSPSVDIEVSVGSSKSVYTKRLTSLEQALPNFSDGSSKGWSVDNFGSMEVVSDSSVASGSALSITLNGRDNKGYQPSFALDASVLGDTSQLSGISFSLYVPEKVADNYKMSVSASYGSVYTYNADCGSVYLKQGWNKVALSLQQSIRSLENLQEFRFYFPNVLDDSGSPSSMNLLLSSPSCSYLCQYDDETVEDFGTVSVQSNATPVSQGDKKTLIVENDVNNVVEEENGEKYLMLGDFENYNQLAQLRYANNFGTISSVSGEDFVTHGEKAMKMEIIGRGENLRKLDPIMTIFTNQSYFQKSNFSDCDYLEADFYNAMEYDIPVRFSNTNIYYSQYSTILSYTLKPGKNHIKIDLNEFSTREFSNFNFIFDRGEYYEGRRTVYFDNFRAHYTKEAA